MFAPSAEDDRVIKLYEGGLRSLFFIIFLSQLKGLRSLFGLRMGDECTTYCHLRELVANLAACGAK
jgi:hypothetical protein